MLEIQSYEAFEELINGPDVVIIDFWAEWCGPCRLISPHFAKAEAGNPKIKFAKVDIDSQEQIAEKESIRSLPSFVAYKNGQRLDAMVGAIPGKLNALIAKAGEVAEAK